LLSLVLCSRIAEFSPAIPIPGDPPRAVAGPASVGNFDKQSGNVLVLRSRMCEFSPATPIPVDPPRVVAGPASVENHHGTGPSLSLWRIL
jgi:hypothetical protein